MSISFKDLNAEDKNKLQIILKSYADSQKYVSSLKKQLQAQQVKYIGEVADLKKYLRKLTEQYRAYKHYVVKQVSANAPYTQRAVPGYQAQPAHAARGSNKYAVEGTIGQERTPRQGITSATSQLNLSNNPVENLKILQNQIANRLYNYVDYMEKYQSNASSVQYLDTLQYSQQTYTGQYYYPSPPSYYLYTDAIREISGQGNILDIINQTLPKFDQESFICQYNDYYLSQQEIDYRIGEIMYYYECQRAYEPAYMNLLKTKQRFEERRKARQQSCDSGIPKGEVSPAQGYRYHAPYDPPQAEVYNRDFVKLNSAVPNPTIISINKTHTPPPVNDVQVSYINVSSVDKQGDRSSAYQQYSSMYAAYVLRQPGTAPNHPSPQILQNTNDGGNQRLAMPTARAPGDVSAATSVVVSYNVAYALQTDRDDSPSDDLPINSAIMSKANSVKNSAVYRLDSSHGQGTAKGKLDINEDYYQKYLKSKSYGSLRPNGVNTTHTVSIDQPRVDLSQNNLYSKFPYNDNNYALQRQAIATDTVRPEPTSHNVKDSYERDHETFPASATADPYYDLLDDNLTVSRHLKVSEARLYDDYKVKYDENLKIKYKYEENIKNTLRDIDVKEIDGLLELLQSSGV